MLQKVVKKATNPSLVNGLQHDMDLYDHYAPEGENHSEIHVQPFLWIADLRRILNRAATRKARAAQRPSELDLLKETRRDNSKRNIAKLVK